MSNITNKSKSRREFLKDTGRIAATSAFMAAAVPRMYAGQSNTIKAVLIGCGGRGTGAASNALSVNNGPVKLVAMGDVFESRLNSSYENLKKIHADQVDVPRERRFVGFDAYKHAMDCLSPGDVAIFATPPAFRWVHFTYAIKKGLNVFMEKPVTVDGPTSRRMFKLAEESTAKNLKVGVGLMSRHSRALEQLAQRIQDGEIGEVILQRGYRMHGPIGFFSSLPKPPGISELLYQVQRFHSFIWASGGNYSDFYIHIIDHQCWMKNAWPIKAQALGGRHYRQSPEGITYVDQNFDTYSVEYTYADGSKFILDGRCIMGCNDIYSSYAHGSKGMAIVSKSGDCGMPSSTYKGQNPTRSNLVWQSKVNPDERDPYQNEWNDLMDAIRNDKPYNETERGVQTSLVTSLGRMAAHTGQEITYDEILNCDHEMAPGLDKLTMDSPAPLQAGPDGKYPVPQPGITKQREY
ncbi:MAG: Gfo/Idh/MocA family oxidoreductase [Sedimentisphaerales bacterium]|jgi:predicted dehydrogenase